MCVFSKLSGFLLEITILLIVKTDKILDGYLKDLIRHLNNIERREYFNKESDPLFNERET